MSYKYSNYTSENLLEKYSNNLKQNINQLKIPNYSQPNAYDDENLYNNKFSNYIYKRNRDNRLMTNLYSKINSILNYYVINTLDEYEYSGSPIYNEGGITNETISQIIDRVIILSITEIEEIEEIYYSQNPNFRGAWDIWMILRNNIEALILNNIFNIRRPKNFLK